MPLIFFGRDIHGHKVPSKHTQGNFSHFLLCVLMAILLLLLLCLGNYYIVQYEKSKCLGKFFSGKTWKCYMLRWSSQLEKPLWKERAAQKIFQIFNFFVGGMGRPNKTNSNTQNLHGFQFISSKTKFQQPVYSLQLYTALALGRLRQGDW